MPDTITITDDRTGKTVTVPIEGGVFPSSALRELDPNLYCYDPAYLSTASCKSEITYLDGGAGILWIVKNYSGDVMNFEMAADMLSGDQDTVLTEVPVRGMWRYYCELMGVR